MLEMALLDCAITEKCCRVDGGQGICPLFSSAPLGIWQLKSPHPREFAIQGKKMLMPEVSPGVEGGEGAGRKWNWLMHNCCNRLLFSGSRQILSTVICVTSIWYVSIVFCRILHKILTITKGTFFDFYFMIRFFSYVYYDVGSIIGCGEVYWFYLEIFLLSFCRLQPIAKDFDTIRSVTTTSCSGRLRRLTDTSSHSHCPYHTDWGLHVHLGLGIQSRYMVCVAEIFSDEVLFELPSSTDLFSYSFVLFF